jgi:hypothetical protein
VLPGGVHSLVIELLVYNRCGHQYESVDAFPVPTSLKSLALVLSLVTKPSGYSHTTPNTHPFGVLHKLIPTIVPLLDTMSLTIVNVCGATGAAIGLPVPYFDDEDEENNSAAVKKEREKEWHATRKRLKSQLSTKVDKVVRQHGVDEGWVEERIVKAIENVRIVDPTVWTVEMAYEGANVPLAML